MHILENEFIRITVQEKGAELVSLLKKETKQEHIWPGKSEIWGRNAPILFPIVGQVRNGKYSVGESEFELSQHGFARDTDFQLINKTDHTLIFSLNENTETLKKYPFQFGLTARFKLNKTSVHISYTIENTGTRTMPFSFGLHPGFLFPEGKSIDDFKLRFEKSETLDRIHIDNGLRNNEFSINFLKDQCEIDLTQDLFAEDALIFKNIQSENVSLMDKDNTTYLTMCFKGFPYLGIWTKPSSNGRFICIEPWHGITDSYVSSEQLEKKEGITLLAQGEVFECSYSIEI